MKTGGGATPDLKILIAEVAQLAIGRARAGDPSVGASFEAMKPFLDDPAVAHVWHALALTSAGRSAEAADMLNREVLADNPGDGLTKSALALALQGGGDARWSRLCAEVLATSSEPHARQLALETMRNAA